MDQPNTGNNKLIIAVVTLVVLGTVGAIAYQNYATPKFNVVTQESMTNSNTTSDTPTPAATADASATMMDHQYKDGTYTKTGNYVSPGGPEQIEVTVVIADDVIKEATVVSKATLDGSKMFQGKFIEGFKEQVIGKSVDSIKLDKVSGSSLTPKGFNDALEQVKAEAKS